MSLKDNNPSVAASIRQLEEIVAWFDQEEIDIETAIEKFEHGRLLADQIADRLRELDNTVTVLREKFDHDA